MTLTRVATLGLAGGLSLKKRRQEIILSWLLGNDGLVAITVTTKNAAAQTLQIREEFRKALALFDDAS